MFKAVDVDPTICKGEQLARLVRCSSCPRCGSGSFRKVRADAVFSLRKVCECRRCSQHFRLPTSVPLNLLGVLLGLGMGVWFAMRVQQVGLRFEVLDPIAPVILAGCGLIVIFYCFIRMIFGRGITPPAKQDWRERSASIPPAVPKGVQIIAIAPTGPTTATAAAAAPQSSWQRPAPPSLAEPASKAASSAVEVSAPPSARQTPPGTTPQYGASPMPAGAVLAALRRGVVIPAHPLAVNRHREFDARRTRALSRYYLAAGAGGLAVGVHTTQFALRKPKFNLLRPVLELVRAEMRQHEEATGRPLVKIAGLCGNTWQAIAEAQVATSLGYDIGLLSLSSFAADASEYDLINHCKKVAEAMPIFGFYLQPAVGGRVLPYSFWRAFAEIPNVVAIKIAAFNRYHTLEVMRAIADSGRALGAAGLATGGAVSAANPIAIYTGNDDAIISDLLGEWTFDVNGKPVSQRIVGGLLGHWACWTRSAVETFENLRQVNMTTALPAEVSMLARQVTDMNAAVFDAANSFRGCIPGVHEVLCRQGLLEGNWCLEPHETLSAGQSEEITRVIKAYPHLTDDGFVREHLEEWMK